MSRPCSKTLAPAAARPRAIAQPRPRELPVTKANRPERSKFAVMVGDSCGRRIVVSTPAIRAQAPAVAIRSTHGLRPGRTMAGVRGYQPLRRAAGRQCGRQLRDGLI